MITILTEIFGMHEHGKVYMVRTTSDGYKVYSVRITDEDTNTRVTVNCINKAAARNLFTAVVKARTEY